MILNMLHEMVETVRKALEMMSVSEKCSLNFKSPRVVGPILTG